MLPVRMMSGRHRDAAQDFIEDRESIEDRERQCNE